MRCDQVDGGVQNAPGVAGFNRARRRLREDAGKAGAFTGQDVHGDAVAANGGGIDPWTAFAHGVIVQQVAGLEVVRAVEDEIGLFEQIFTVPRSKVFHVRLYRDGGVDLLQLAMSGNRLGQRFGGIALVEQNLPLQIAGLNVVAVDDADVAYAGANQQRAEHRSGGSAADDGDARLCQFALPLGANAGKQ